MFLPLQIVNLLSLLSLSLSPLCSLSQSSLYSLSVLIHTVQLKPTIKAHFSGRMVSSGIRGVAFASVHYEKTCLKKLIMIIIIIIMNKSQERTVFSGHQKLNSAMKLRPEN